MAKRTILYFDHSSEVIKKIMLSHIPDGFELIFWHDLEETEKYNRLETADYLLVATAKMDESLLSRAKRVKFLQKTGIGVDNIDLQAASRHGIPVSNTPGGNATGVAELTLLHILALYRKLPYVNQATKNGQWLMWELRPHLFEMEGKTHGIIGFGNIGKEVAKRSKAMGTRIVYYDIYRANEETEQKFDAVFLPLHELLETADIVSLHVPLLETTRNLIGEKELLRMKKTAILVNVARGGVVDEGALYRALSEGWILGAGIDVWAQEPPDPGHPLFKLDNVIATPHLGAGTIDTFNRVLGMAFDNISRVEQGHPPQYVVNGINARFP